MKQVLQKGFFYFLFIYYFFFKKKKCSSLFIASMSHELRTPLHGILASADLLQEICQTEEQQTFISTIRACGKNVIFFFFLKKKQTKSKKKKNS